MNTNQKSKKKEQIVLRFSILPIISSPFSELSEILEWCSKRQMDIFKSPIDLDYRLVLYRDRNTYDFIKTFIEPKVRTALPFNKETFSLIDGVAVEESYE